MRIKLTCPISIQTTRLSAKWLAQKYESLFRSDLTTGIQKKVTVGRGRGAFSAPRQSGPSTSTAPSTSVAGRGAGGRHTGWGRYFYASGN